MASLGGESDGGGGWDDGRRRERGASRQGWQEKEKEVGRRDCWEERAAAAMG
ncbi:hypothetical protein TIFTF001_020336 [Ficus carica]|uniref:Uncharacterized protein n=1 Tax=Ficus carica TaxID=3494 RepID=A0AA88AFV5_FICCA|nr:hypothetical protein TIFTF001_020336 [Ficus carica]